MNELNRNKKIRQPKVIKAFPFYKAFEFVRVRSTNRFILLFQIHSALGLAVQFGNATVVAYLVSMQPRLVF